MEAESTSLSFLFFFLPVISWIRNDDDYNKLNSWLINDDDVDGVPM